MKTKKTAYRKLAGLLSLRKAVAPPASPPGSTPIAAPAAAMESAAMESRLQELWRQQDLPAAIEQAHRLRQAHPQMAAGYRIGAQALRQTGAFAPAEALLTQAESIFANAVWPYEERFRMAQHAGNLPDAAAQAELMRSRFPEREAGWRLGFTASQGLGRNDAATALLRDAEQKFPGHAWVLAGLTMLARQRQDWNETAARAAALRLAFPGNDEGYRAGLLSLRRLGRYDEAAALLGEAAQWRETPWLLTETAALAQARGDADAAIDAWRHVRAVHPTRPDGYIGGFKSCLAAKRFDLANALHHDAVSQFPPVAWLMIQAAELHFATGRFEDAAQAWRALRAAYPGSLEGYHGGYRTYRKLGDLALAEDLLQEALAKFPANRWALVEAAHLADARYDYDQVDQRWAHAAAVLPGDPEIALKFALARTLDRKLKNRDYPTALSRLRTLNARLPDYAPAWAAHIKTLRFTNALTEAEQMAQACTHRMPDEPALWLEYALTAGEDAHLAATRLAEAAARCPGHEILQGEFAKALGRSGRLDEAEQQYLTALARFPDSADLLCGYAEIAMRRQDWPQALLRWQRVRGKFPEERRMTSGMIDTQAELAAQGAATPSLATPAAHGVTEAERGHAEIFGSFESLGGTGQGCEFGLVQRAGGVEPLGLLRWAQIGPEDLLEGLTSRFRGVGTPEQTMVDYYIGEDPENPEYRYNDTRLNIRMHTFVRKRDVAKDKMDRQTCLRMKFLQRKLIQDLEDGEKIFVYKIHERNLDEDELLRLRGAMRGFGDNTLLYVRYAEDQHPSGTLVARDDGLLIGYISRFNIDPETRKIRAPDLPAWNAICRAAFDWRETRGALN